MILVGDRVMDPMKKLIADAEWEAAVRSLQDKEREFFVTPYDTMRACSDILRYVTVIRIREPNFWQRKGGEFEAMIKSLKYDEEVLLRITSDDEFWSATLRVIGKNE